MFSDKWENLIEIIRNFYNNVLYKKVPTSMPYSVVSELLYKSSSGYLQNVTEDITDKL